MDNVSVPRKQCSRKDQCIHPETENGWLPATIGYFCRNAKSPSGLYSLCISCKNANGRRRYHTPEVKAARNEQIRAYQQTAKGGEVRKRSDANQRLRHPEKISARRAVYTAIKNGKLPPVAALSCSYCGAQAEHYHHHLGYSTEHRLDVIPLCLSCHLVTRRKIT